jgi:pimeloyl-ACP methyl ester carboxylesterase
MDDAGWNLTAAAPEAVASVVLVAAPPRTPDSASLASDEVAAWIASNKPTPIAANNMMKPIAATAW